MMALLFMKKRERVEEGKKMFDKMNCEHEYMRYKVTTKHVVIFIYTVGYRDNLCEEELQFLAHSSEKKHKYHFHTYQ